MHTRASVLTLALVSSTWLVSACSEHAASPGDLADRQIDGGQMDATFEDDASTGLDGSKQEDASIDRDAAQSDAGVPSDACGVAPADVINGSYLEAAHVQVLAANQPWPRSLTKLGDQLYWANYEERSPILRMDERGCRTEEMTPPQYSPVSLITDGFKIYWVTSLGELRSYDPATNLTRQLSDQINPYSGLVFTNTDIYSVSGLCVLNVIHSGQSSPEAVTPMFGGKGQFARKWGTHALFSCLGPHAIYDYDTTASTVHRLVSRRTRISALTASTSAVVWSEDTCDDVSEACPLADPGCCPGRIMLLNSRTGETSTVATDRTSAAVTISIHDDWIYWSNWLEIRRIRTSSRAGSGEVFAPLQGWADGFVFDDDYMYWVNPNRHVDVIRAEGTIERKRPAD